MRSNSIVLPGPIFSLRGKIGNADAVRLENMMTELVLKLPDSLAKEAAQAGLLSEAEIERLLREEIRRRQLGELFDAMDRMAAVEGEPMTEDEIQAEIDAARAARRAARGR